MKRTVTRISRQSSCHSLKLPIALCCEFCKPGMQRLALGLQTSCKFKRCRQMWGTKFASHRELRFVQMHHQTLDVLGEIVMEGDTLVNT